MLYGHRNQKASVLGTVKRLPKSGVYLNKLAFCSNTICPKRSLEAIENKTYRQRQRGRGMRQVICAAGHWGVVVVVVTLLHPIR